jgi:hypothetical protein
VAPRVAAATVLVLNCLLPLLKKHFEKLLTELQLYEQHLSMFIIRSMADEATGILTAAQFMAWVLDYILGWASFAAVSLSSLLNQSKSLAEKVAKSVLVVVPAALVIGLLTTSSFARETIVFKIGEIVGLIGLSVIVLPAPFFWLLLILGFAGVLFSSLVPLIVGLVFALTFGPEVLLAGLIMDLAVEPVPVGNWKVLLLAGRGITGSAPDHPPFPVAKPRTIGHFLYGDPEVIRLIAEWIVGGNQTTGERLRGIHECTSGGATEV